MRNVVNPISLISRWGSRDLIGIDFHGNSLKMAHLKVLPNHMEVAKVLTRSIVGVNDDDLSQLIRSCIKEINVKSARVINVIPASLVITKNIEIPSNNPQEIKEIIGLQAGRHTPYSREEIIVDYLEVGTYRRNYTKILLIIVARQVIRREYAILEKALVHPEHFIFVPESFALTASRILKVNCHESPVAVIHVDDASSDFNVIYKEKVIFVRSIPLGAQHLIDEAESYELRFVEEMKSSFEAYVSEEIERPPSSVVMAGAVEGFTTLVSLLNEKLRIPVKIVSYSKGISFSHEALTKVSSANHVSFLPCIAPLFALGELKINLVPDEIKMRKVFEERSKELLKTGMLVLSIFLLVFLILISQIYFNRAYIKKLDAAYAPVGAQAKELEKEFEKTGKIKGLLLQRGFSLEALSELYSALPDDVLINDVRFDGIDRFSVRGTAETMPAVVSFNEALSKSAYFKDVKTKYMTKRKEGQQDVTDFEISSAISMKRR